MSNQQEQRKFLLQLSLPQVFLSHAQRRVVSNMKGNTELVLKQQLITCNMHVQASDIGWQELYISE